MKNKLLFSVFVVAFSFASPSLIGQNSNKIDSEVNNLLKKKREYNKTYSFGYKIQLYNGNEKTAKSKQAKFKILYPRVSSRLIYNSPEWKVQVGDYKTKLEADKAKILFKEEFSNTIVVPMGK